MGAISKFLEYLDREKKGLVGVGILIIFIGIVIVATVAAGVLINTGTALQGQARDTSRSAMRQVSSGIRVLTINGRAGQVYRLENTRNSNTWLSQESYASNDNIKVLDKTTVVENIELFVKTRPGSPGINLGRMSIEYVSSEAERHLVMHDNAYHTREDFYNSSVYGELSDDKFAVVKIKNPSGTDNYMLSTTSDMAEIWIDTWTIEKGLQPAQAVELALMPDTGFKTYATGRTPATMARTGVFKLRL